MKASIEFELPEDTVSWRMHTHTFEAYDLILRLDTELRNTLKYDELDEQATELLRNLRSLITEAGVLEFFE